MGPAWATRDVSHIKERQTNFKYRRGCAERGTLYTLLVEIYISLTTVENNMQVFQKKLKVELPLTQSTTLGHLHEENEVADKKIPTRPCSFRHCSQ